MNDDPSGISDDPAEIKHGPLARAGQHLITIHREFEAYLRGPDRDRPFASSLAGLVRVEGETVGVQVRGEGDVERLARTVEALGLRVGAKLAQPVLIEGMLPIGRLPALVAAAEVRGIAPLYRPMVHRGGPWRGPARGC